MKNMKIGKKLVLGFGVTIVASIIDVDFYFFCEKSRNPYE